MNTKSNSNHLITSGLVFCIILIFWPVLAVVNAPKGTIAEQLALLQNNTGLYSLGFIMAFFIAPSITYLILSLKSTIFTTNNSFRQFGSVFLIVYIVFVSISYGSQFLLLPQMLKNNQQELARLWYFHDPDSIAYLINQTGYACWAICVIMIFSSLLKYKGLEKLLGIIIMISAILSIIAFAGLLFKNQFLNSLTVVGGLLTLPIGIIAIVLGQRIKKLLHKKVE